MPDQLTTMDLGLCAVVLAVGFCVPLLVFAGAIAIRRCAAGTRCRRSRRRQRAAGGC